VAVDEKDIEVVGLGWEVPIGDTLLQVRPQADGAFITDVIDGSGTSLGSTYSELFTLAPPTGWDAPVSASAGDVHVIIDRRWAGQGIGESSIYGVALVELAWGDERRRVEAWDRIDYVNTHHNWNDTLAATTDDGLVLHWKIVYDFQHGDGLVQTVWVTDADGAEVLAPTIVTPDATEE
jgi:hypothetical protein